MGATVKSLRTPLAIAVLATVLRCQTRQHLRGAKIGVRTMKAKTNASGNLAELVPFARHLFQQTPRHVNIGARTTKTKTSATGKLAKTVLFARQLEFRRAASI